MKKWILLMAACTLFAAADASAETATHKRGEGTFLGRAANHVTDWLARHSTWRPVDANSSWDEIARSGLKVKWAYVGIGNAAFAVGGLCVDGDNLRPLDPYGRQCVEYAGGESGTCVRWEELYYSTPRTYTYRTCVRWADEGESARCVEYGVGTATIPLSYDIDVFKVTDAGESVVEEKVFTKHFDIPGCAK